MIRHLVFAGGGTLVLRALGSFQYLMENHYICYEDIETVYGTSAGAILGAFFCLKLDVSILTSYFIHRPWEDIFEITPTHLYNFYSRYP